MELTQKRWQEIAQALFDHYVRKRFIGENFIIVDKEINKRQLLLFSKLANCEPDSLEASIRASCGRIGHISLAGQLPKRDEREIILAVIKAYVRIINIPLKDYKRSFGNMTSEINYCNPSLHLKTKELVCFAYPIYRAVFEEIFKPEPVNEPMMIY